MVLNKLASFISGDSNKKMLKIASKLVPLINEKFEYYSENLKNQSDYVEEYQRLKELHLKDGKTLNELLPEVFALIKSAAKFLNGTKFDLMRTEEVWNMIHYDVQLIGGIIIHNGNIAEMRTGEGKTLVCTLPVILNTLTDRPVMVVTVNDYLAQRDSNWMSVLYSFFGLKTGVVIPNQPIEQKKEAYNSNIIYGTNN